MARSKKAEREHLRRQMLADGVPVAQIAIEMGRRFRARPRTAWRYALGWDQWKAVQEYRTANSVAIDESRISRWESWPHGGTRPSPENLVGLVRAFGHGCTVAGLVDDDDLNNYSPTTRQLLGTEPTSTSRSTSMDDARPTAQQTGRDTVGTGTAGAEAVGSIPGNLRLANDTSSLAYALDMVESGQPDGLGVAIDALDEVIALGSDRLATDGPASVQADLLTARQFARSLFDQYKPVGVRAADVQAAAAWLSSLLAVATSYAGDHTSALVWALDAQNRGQAAGHPVISGWALLTRATVSHYQGRAARSLDLASQGAAVAPVGTAAFAKLTSQQMRSHASLGDTQGMQSARRRAQSAISALDDAGNTGVHSIARAAEPPYTAASLLLVGEHAEASAITEDLITTAYPHGRARETSSYARTLLVLALAQAGLGRLDEAAATGSTALSVPGTVWPTVVLAGKLDRALADTGDSDVPEASEFAGLYRDAARDLAAARSRT